MFFKIKEALDFLASPLYFARGNRPWSAGYYTAKKRAICTGIDEGVLVRNNDLPSGYGRRIDERVVEYPWVYSQLPAVPGKILDAGSALNHDFLIARAPLSNAVLSIMTLAPEKRCFWEKSISYVFGDLRKTQLADSVFDVVVSVSTIEHIGLDNTLFYTGDSSKKETDVMGFVPAVTEFKRMLKSGGLCLITVPFGRPGAHGWYQVFDFNLVMKVIESFQPTDYSIDYFGYDEKGWHRAELKDVENVEFFDIHEGKPFATDYAAGARGVACIRLIA